MDSGIKSKIMNAFAQALDAVGIDDLGGDEYGEMDGVGPSGSEVPIWSKLQSPEGLGAGKGQIHDKSALLGVKAQTEPQGRVDAYGMPLPGEAEDGMLALGLV